MAEQFHEGQDVKVRICEADPVRHGFHVRWRNAKIVSYEAHEPGKYFIQFSDGTRAVFDNVSILPVANAEGQS